MLFGLIRYLGLVIIFFWNFLFEFCLMIVWNLIIFCGVGVLKMFIGFLGIDEVYVVFEDIFWFLKCDWENNLVFCLFLKFLKWEFFIFLIIFSVLFLFVKIVGMVGDVFLDKEEFILK